MDDLKISYTEVNALKPYAKIARTHSKKQIEQIAESITTFGWTNPILTDGKDTVVAGHGRLAAAKLLGLKQVPTIPMAALTPEQIRAYIIADNRLAENAGWDREILGLELQVLASLDLDFDLTVTGFEPPEIDLLIGDLEAEDDRDLDTVPEVRPGLPVTEKGDLWLIGHHRLYCGDATDPTAYELLLGGKKAQMVFTDPPYNVKIDGHVSGLGKIRHREFAMASGELDLESFTAFLRDVFTNLATHSADGSLHFVCMDWRHLGEVLSAGGKAYSEFKNLCVWAKTNGGMGSLYRSRHELVFVFKAGTAPHINNVELGRFGRYRSNVWNYPGVNSFGKGRDEALAMHPTVKPVALVKDAISDCSNRGDIVLDALLGSGTSLVAADLAGRRGYGIEIDPQYCDVAVRRLLELNPELAAVHQSTNASFEAIARQRAGARGEADGVAPQVPGEVA